MSPDLAFDVGAADGADSAYYLGKGFRASHLGDWFDIHAAV